MPRRRLHCATQILVLQIVVRTLHDRPDALRLRQLGKIVGHHVMTIAPIGRVLVAADPFVIVNASADTVTGIDARR